MSESEQRRTEQEALPQAAKPMTSRRAEVWSAMMRYLSGEATREHKLAESERSGKERPGKQSEDRSTEGPA